MRTKNFKHELALIPSIVANHTESGHFYSFQDNKNNSFKVASITTMLGSIPNPAIVEWQNVVGIEKANQIKDIAAAQGTALHQAVNAYLVNAPHFPEGAPSMPNIVELFRKIQPCLDKIGTIYLLESPLCAKWPDTSKDFLEAIPFSMYIAGQPDIVARMPHDNNRFHVIDIKTASKLKTAEELYSYRLQVAAYAIMFNYTYGIPVDKYTLMIAGDEGVQAVEGSIFDHTLDLSKVVCQYYLTHENPQYYIANTNPSKLAHSARIV
jgi:hypothetical protein